MKLITFAVPCYNSQDYMRRCIDTLLTGGEKVEIIIVDDGSKIVRVRLPMNMRRNILPLSKRFTRKIRGMDRA